MRIAIDCRVLNSRGKSGIANYAVNLLDRLQKLDNANEYILITGNGGQQKRDGFNEYMAGVSIESHPLSELWENTCLPVELFRKGIDVLHSLHLFLPLWSIKCRNVITVHDLVAFKFPQLFPRRYSILVRAKMAIAVKKADSIAANSENTKNDLMEVLEVPGGKIKVTHLGADRMFRKVENREVLKAVRKKYSQGYPFILNVGTLEPRKNAVRLIRAFEALRSKITEKFRLVIIGGKGWLYDDIFKAMERSRVSDDIIIVEGVEDKELPLLYSAASLFVYPALYEGFGLPVLEAMACGAPVISSDVSSIPELTGDSAVLVNPESETEITDAMYDLLRDESRLREFSKLGIERAKQFSWENTARKTVELYTEQRG